MVQRPVAHRLDGQYDVGFNEAAPVMVQRPSNAQPEWPRQSRFNEAAPVMVQRLAFGIGGGFRIAKLQ